MSAEYMHIGIPVTTKKPNMVYNDVLKFWVNTDVDAYDYKIEYLMRELHFLRSCIKILMLHTK